MHSDKFPGFPRELEKSYWQFPTIINGHAHSLTGAEFKVLWYILRHTFGWQKTTDRLSLSQICNGIKKRNGEHFDKGTGLSKPWVIKATKTLERKGFIKVKRSKGKSNEITLMITGKENKPVNKVNQNQLRKLTRTGKESLHTIDITNRIPIKDSDIAPKSKSGSCPNKQETHKGCIEFIDSFAESRGVKFANYPKQINGLHKLLRAGYTFSQINKQIDVMEKKKFWMSNGFDLMNVVNEIGKGSYG